MKVCSCNLAASVKVEKTIWCLRLQHLRHRESFCVMGRWIKRFFWGSLMRNTAFFFLHMAQLLDCALECLIMRAHKGINHLVRTVSRSQRACEWPYSHFRAFFFNFNCVYAYVFIPPRRCLWLCCTPVPNTTTLSLPLSFHPSFCSTTKCQGKTSAQIHFVMLKPRGTHVLLLAHWACYLTPRRWMSACTASSWMQDLNSIVGWMETNTWASRFIGAHRVSRWNIKMEEQWAAPMFLTSQIASRCVVAHLASHVI